uniref:BAHD acyltransferase n=2 Tax=Brassica oleracea var. oleracea TaxID=109376 RepID=A0A0D3C0T7_BRAOL
MLLKGEFPRGGLSHFDLPWKNLPTMQRVIFYRLHELSAESFYSQIFPKLERSLSITLHHYSPLAGRLTWDAQDPKLCILFSQGDSTTLTVAETEADFSCVSGDGLRPAAELRSFVPSLKASDDSASALSLQITFFPNQGFCIGVTSHHGAVDGKVFLMFIKSWAYVCRLQEHEATKNLPVLPEELTPSFDRTVINIPTRLEEEILGMSAKYRNNIMRTLNPSPAPEITADTISATVELTRENIEKLKERVKNESTRPLELRLSTYVIAFAYAWTWVVKACEDDANRPVGLLVAADFRHRLSPRVPDTYFGNCVFPIGLFGYEAREFSEEDGFVKVVEILSDAVHGLDSGEIESHCMNYVGGVKKIKPGAQIGAIAGSPRLGIYGVDFGWGRPAKTDLVTIDRTKGFFSLSERKNGQDGVEMGLCLEKSEMNIFLSLYKNGL